MTWWDLIIWEMKYLKLRECTRLKLYMIQVVILDVKFFKALKVDKLFDVDAVIWDVKVLKILLEVNQIFFSHIDDVLPRQLWPDCFMGKFNSAGE
jgi:hypothetical protein